LAGAVFANAPGGATCVVKLQKLVLAPSASVGVVPDRVARTCQKYVVPGLRPLIVAASAPFVEVQAPSHAPLLIVSRQYS
jgi:hypothetical protein